MIRHLEAGYNVAPGVFVQAFNDQKCGQNIFPDNPAPHPNTVLNVMLQCNVESCLSSAYYEVCAGGIESMFSSDHLLSPKITKVAVLGLVNIKDAEDDNIRKAFAEFSEACVCKSNLGTSTQLALLRAYIIARSGRMETAAFNHLNDIKCLKDFCKYCQKEWATKFAEGRGRIYKKLPEFFQLPPRK